MTKPKVYLCGPMHNKSYEAARTWRTQASVKLEMSGVECHDPMRSKDYLEGSKNLDHHHDHPLSTPKAITVRDRFDCMRADAVLANLSWTPGDLISIGSIMEITWADAARIPIIAVLNDEGPYIEHPMLSECIGFIAGDLDEALELTIAVVK